MEVWIVRDDQTDAADFVDQGRTESSPDVEQFKAILAAEIIKLLDKKKLSVRAAHALTGVAAADFSRIRKADLGRFTVDRLMSIINRLGAKIELELSVRPIARRRAVVA